MIGASADKTRIGCGATTIRKARNDYERGIIHMDGPACRHGTRTKRPTGFGSLRGH